MAKSKQNSSKRNVQISKLQLIVFLTLFAAVGVYALLQSFARSAPIGTCSYNKPVVSATGLPKDTVINFFVTDSNTGKSTGWVLGTTPDGTWSVDLSSQLSSVPVPTGPTTFDFVSRGYGSSNKPKYNTYAECSTSV